MRIALFTDTFAPQVNGVAKTLGRLVNYFEKENIPHEIFVPEQVDDNSLFSGNVHGFTSLPFLLYPECRIALPNILKIRNRLQTLQPDLIHLATPFNVGLCGLHYATKYHVPYVASYHTHFDQYLDYYKLGFMLPWIWKYQHWFHRNAKKIFVPSNETKNHLEEKGFKELELWPRGVDCHIFNPHRNKRDFKERYHITKKYTLLYVGRVAPEKDLHILSEMVENLSSELKKEVQWVVVGEGPMLSELKQKHKQDICFTGYLDGEELADAYTAADLFVFPSSSETFGNVVLEALASGTPAIVANSGGVKEIVIDGVTGILCSPNDTASFIEGVERMLLSHSLRRSMSLKSRSYSKKQSWDKIFSNLLFQYEKVTTEHKLTQLV
ncbi:glycosyltransferase family 1 protein [Evansella sp. AB-P1]|uniref:glycosyltransferase family 4 protein n=1 Tax=Evansella sp. AB-P1 TaxID=3037653 RepID=UPI00241D7C84|nr:glycosyltransferase family 1 protein [Evansella sp. AB-P1]MDG5787763.1 glycosyltransferase family 1 protein [Evansella sp. AB-P1]